MLEDPLTRLTHLPVSIFAPLTIALAYQAMIYQIPQIFAPPVRYRQFELFWPLFSNFLYIGSINLQTHGFLITHESTGLVLLQLGIVLRMAYSGIFAIAYTWFYLVGHRQASTCCRPLIWTLIVASMAHVVR